MIRSTSALLLTIALLVTIAGCSSRAPHPDTVAVDHVPPLALDKANALVRRWRDHIDAYLRRGNEGPASRIARVRHANSAQAPRPGRITLGLLGDDANGWDSNGLLLDRYSVNGHDWFIFMVGTMRRLGYRPRELQDLRPVAVRFVQNNPIWVLGVHDQQALSQYIAVHGRDMPRGFPAIHDQFILQGNGASIAIEEFFSAGRWTLTLPQQ